MTDDEMFRLAAKAAGYIYVEHTGYGDGDVVITRRRIRENNDPNGALIPWNPRDDDGDSLRLAVKLGMSIDFSRYTQTVYFATGKFVQECWHKTNDPYAATRRAIFRAAVEIGKEMK